MRVRPFVMSARPVFARTRRLPGRRRAPGLGFAVHGLGAAALSLAAAIATVGTLSAEQGAAPPRAAEVAPVASDATRADVAESRAAEGTLVAGAAVPQGWAFELSHAIMSPFCPGLALSECPSPQAAELRDWIIEQERLGLSRADVEAQLFLQYGDQLLQAPRPEGFGLLAYALPAAGLLIGFALMARTLAGVRRRRAEAAAPSATQGAGVAPEIERLLNAEIGD